MRAEIFRSVRAVFQKTSTKQKELFGLGLKIFSVQNTEGD